MDPVTLDVLTLFSVVVGSVAVGILFGAAAGYHTGVSDRRPTRRRVGRHD